jgi:phosphatidylserine/phosphatidylglycerophosphate/cardiolipin synthase-like enzyme
MHELILNRAHYERVIVDVLQSATRYLWMATADLKDLHVQGPGRRFVPLLSVWADQVERGVAIRLFHAKEPGTAFRADFDRFPVLAQSDGFERILCPRMHMKVIVVDGRVAYVGSANLTGAGIGAKSALRRNFEAGFLTDDPDAIGQLMAELDRLYLGEHCVKCGRREFCPDPIR